MNLREMMDKIETRILNFFLVSVFVLFTHA